MREDIFKRLCSFKSEQYGTVADAQFDDFDKFLKLDVKAVTSVKVWHGDVIDGVEFVYGNTEYKKGESPFFHGGKMGNLSEFKLSPDDSIQKIEGEYGRYPYAGEFSQTKKDVILRLRFVTRYGVTSPWFGNSYWKGDKLKGQPFTIEAGPSFDIVALTGATWKKEPLMYSDYLQAIGCTFISHMDMDYLSEVYEGME